MSQLILWQLTTVSNGYYWYMEQILRAKFVVPGMYVMNSSLTSCSCSPYGATLLGPAAALLRDLVSYVVLVVLLGVCAYLVRA